MTIVRCNPLNTVSVLKDFDTIANSFCNRPFGWFGEVEGKWMPRIDILERENAYELYAELPGIEKKDITITIKDDMLMLSGEKKAEEKREGEDYFCCERRYGTFQRSFRMAEPIDPKEITAEFTNGVLKISIPKKEVKEAKTAKIEIK